MEEENPTDQELADYFQAHKGDPDEWGDPEPAPEFMRKHKSRDLSMKITVRFTPDEGALIRSEAAWPGRGVSVGGSAAAACNS